MIVDDWSPEVQQIYRASVNSRAAQLGQSSATGYGASSAQATSEGLNTDVARGLVNGLAFSALLWAAGILIIP